MRFQWPICNECNALNKDAAGKCVCVCDSTDTACLRRRRGVGEEHHRQTDEVSAFFFYFFFYIFSDFGPFLGG